MLAPPQHTDAVAVEDTRLRKLPDGWTLATISELIGRGGIFVDGDWVESKDQDPSGDVRLIQLADVGDGVYLDKSSRFLTAKKSRELNCTYLASGDVLIARMPDPLGRACIYPGDPKTSVTAVDVCIVRTGEYGPDHHWLAWFVNSPDFRDNVALLQSGSTRKRISRRNLATIALPIPPFPEQRRIVAEIEKQFTRLDASVAALKRVQANLERYRASVLKAACEGALVPTEAELARADGRDYEPADQLLQRILSERRARWESQENRGRKYKEPVAPDTAELPELPGGWVWATADQLLVRSEYGTSVRCSYESDGLPVLRIPNIVHGNIDLRDLKYATRPLPIDSQRALQAGDVLMCRTNGSVSLVGKTAVIKTNFEVFHSFASYLLRFRFANAQSLPQWFHIFTTSQLGRSFIESNAASSAGQHNVSLKLIHGMAISVPPLAEQRRIVAEVERRLSVIQQAEAAVEANLTRAERLKQSILKQAFSGQLVPQDPNDEPASMLLKRIRAEREAAQAAARSNRKPSRRRSGKRRERQPARREAAS